MQPRTRHILARGCLSFWTFLSFALAIVIIVFSGIQAKDTITDSKVYPGSFCHDTTLNSLRPFKMRSVPNGESAANQTTFKVCAKLIGASSDGGSNGTTKCIFPKARKTDTGDFVQDEMYFECGWDPITGTTKRIGIAIGMLFAPLLLILWFVKDYTAVGKAVGVVFIILSFLALVGHMYLMVTDANSVRISNDQCIKSYRDGPMCNPFDRYYKSSCTCDYREFIGLTMMDVAGIGIWTLIFCFSIFRMWAYRYSDVRLETITTVEETVPVISESERRISQIANSYKT